MSKYLIVPALSGLALGCAQFRPPPKGADHEASATPDACSRGAQIENGEDGDDQIAVRDGRGGYLYTYGDDKGTELEPKGDDVRPASGGANGSEYALRIQGKLGDSDDAFAGIGFAFAEPKGPYDASRWRGVSFMARRSPATVAAARLKIPDVHTDPDGKVCTDCYNDFGVAFQLEEGWTRYEVDFANLKQEPDWGNPRPEKIDPAKLYGLQWQVVGRKGEFDLWIDDVSFLGCPTGGQEK